MTGYSPEDLDYLAQGRAISDDAFRAILADPDAVSLIARAITRVQVLFADADRVCDPVDAPEMPFTFAELADCIEGSPCRPGVAEFVAEHFPEALGGSQPLQFATSLGNSLLNTRESADLHGARSEPLGVVSLHNHSALNTSSLGSPAPAISAEVNRLRDRLRVFQSLAYLNISGTAILAIALLVNNWQAEPTVAQLSQRQGAAEVLYQHSGADDTPEAVQAAVLERGTARRFETMSAAFSTGGASGDANAVEQYNSAATGLLQYVSSRSQVPFQGSNAYSFDEAVMAYAAGLLGKGPHFSIVNAAPMPERYDDPTSARYYFSRMAVDRLRDVFSSRSHSDDSAIPEVRVLVELEKNGLQGWLICDTSSVLNGSSRSRVPFAVEAKPVALLSHFSALVDRQGMVETKSNGNDLTFTFSGGDSPFAMISLAARKGNTIRNMFGLRGDKSGIAEIVFDVKSEFKGPGNAPDIEFITGGMGIPKSGPPAIRSTSQWQRVVIPVNVSASDQWDILLSIAVQGLTADGAGLTVTIRDAYYYLHVEPSRDVPDDSAASVL